MAKKSNIIFTKEDRDRFRKTREYKNTITDLSWLILKMEVFKCFSFILFFFGRKERKNILRKINVLINRANRNLKSVQRYPEKLFLISNANEKEKTNQKTR